MTKKVFLVGDIGTGENGYFHIGDEAMWLKNADRYLKNNWSVIASSRNASDRYRNVKFLADIFIDNYKSFQDCTKPDHSDYRRFADAISDVDVVHLSGGGNLNNLWPGHFYFRCFIVDIAQKLNKKLIATSQTIGPLTDSQQSLLSSYAKAFSYFGVRDEHASLMLLRALGFKEECIGIDPDDALTIYLPHKTNKTAKYFISLHEDQATQTLQEILKGVTNLCNTPQVITSASFESKKTIASLCVPFPNSSDDKHSLVNWSVDTVGATEGGLSSRYHPVVFALMQGIPAVSIAINDYYATKFSGLYEYFEIPAREFVLPPDSLRDFQDVISLLRKQKSFLHLPTIQKKLSLDRKRLYEISKH